MASYNKMTIIANSGGDAEMRYLASGKAVTEVRVAVNERRGGEEKTIWFKLVFWDKLAEVAAQYIKKGKQVYVEGPLSIDEFIGKDGTARFQPVITVREMQLLGGAADGGNGGGGYDRPSKGADAEGSTLDDIPF